MLNGLRFRLAKDKSCSPPAKDRGGRHPAYTRERPDFAFFSRTRPRRKTVEVAPILHARKIGFHLFCCTLTGGEHICCTLTTGEHMGWRTHLLHTYTRIPFSFWLLEPVGDVVPKRIQFWIREVMLFFALTAVLVIVQVYGWICTHFPPPPTNFSAFDSDSRKK